MLFIIVLYKYECYSHALRDPSHTFSQLGTSMSTPVGSIAPQSFGQKSNKLSRALRVKHAVLQTDFPRSLISCISPPMRVQTLEQHRGVTGPGGCGAGREDGLQALVRSMLTILEIIGIRIRF